MDTSAFSAVMQRGLDEAKADRSRLAADVFAELRQEIWRMADIYTVKITAQAGKVLWKPFGRHTKTETSRD